MFLATYQIIYCKTLKKDTIIDYKIVRLLYYSYQL